MNRRDLDTAASLFDLANDGYDEDVWARRFQDHIAHAMRELRGVASATGGDPEERRIQVLRTRLELHEIVADRVQDRILRLDTQLGKAYDALRQANAPIFNEVLESVRSIARVARAEQGDAQACDKSAPPLDKPAVTLATADGGILQLSPTHSYNASTSKLHLSMPRLPLEDLSCSADVTPRFTTSIEVSPRLGSPVDMSPSKLASADLVATLLPPASELGKSTGEFSGSQTRTPKACVPLPANAPKVSRDLTLKQLRDFMSGVYASKAVHNARCESSQEPVETMEQHLYSYLGKRYGLKSVAHERAQAIYRAIQRYATQECDVLVFAKILKNTLPETFLQVQDTLRTSVHALLQHNLKRRHPGRLQCEVDAMWRKRARYGVPFAECEEVVRRIYSEEDAELVLETARARMGHGAGGNSPRPDADDARVAADAAMPYRDLMQVLLTFQLNLMEEFYADFVEHFRALDKQGHGILSAESLDLLIGDLSFTSGPAGPPQVQDAISRAQRAARERIRGHGQATFSESTDLLRDLIVVRSEFASEMGRFP